jgi:small subunit ribosomal protein S16
MGKIRNPQYRIVVADARTKRDGRAIEQLGIYHPKEDPSLIEVNSDRVQYWLKVGAQPSEAVQAILSKTGDWQKFKGLPAPEPLKVAPARADRTAIYEAEAKAAAGLTETAATRPAKRTEPRKATKAVPAEAGTSQAVPADAGTSQALPAEAGTSQAVPAEAAPAAADATTARDAAGPNAEEPAGAGADAEV